MQQKSKVNWWAILAVAIIGVPVGFIGSKFIPKPDIQSDTTDIVIKPDTVPQPIPEPQFLTVGQNQISFNADGGKEKLGIESNMQWQVVTAEDGGWLTINPKQGEGNGTVALSAKANSSTKARATYISIQWTDGSGAAQQQDIEVRQAAVSGGPEPPVPTLDPKPYLSVSSSSLSFPTSGGSKNITVKSNMTLSIQVSGGDGWLTLSTTEGRATKTVTVIAAGNTTTEPRKADMEVTGTDDDGNTIRRTISITQAKAEPLPSPLTKEQVQAIISQGQSHRQIPDNCRATVNGTAMSYSSFCKNVRGKKYSSVRVEGFENDSYNNVKSLSINAIVKEPEPKQLTKKEVQKLINDGKNDEMIASSCNVVVNGGTSMSYNSFLAQRENYSGTIVQRLEYNNGDKKVSIIYVEAAIEKKMSVEEAQRIIDKLGNEIPAECWIVINDGEETKQYFNFIRGVQFGTYLKPRVQSVECDTKGNAKKIRVMTSKTK